MATGKNWRKARNNLSCNSHSVAGLSCHAYGRLEIHLDSLRVHVGRVWCMFPRTLDDTFKVASIKNCTPNVVGSYSEHGGTHYYRS